MNDECRCWFQYAEENKQVAELCFESGLFNSCLQNAQQAVENNLAQRCLALANRVFDDVRRRLNADHLL